MLNIKEAIIVEGKYDKALLKQLTDAVIIETNGFAVYTDKRLLSSIKKLPYKFKPLNGLNSLNKKAKVLSSP